MQIWFSNAKGTKKKQNFCLKYKHKDIYITEYITTWNEETEGGEIVLL